ncbi:MAG: NAD(P)H-dependent oxidoreductase [Bacteroidota bacterium]
MQVSVILAHPNPKSFNHAIAETVIAELNQNSHQVFFHNLYAEQFDPILKTSEILNDSGLPMELESHCHEISNADGIVIIHPNWWGQPPAILKGWVDRVLRQGTAYKFLEGDNGEGIPVGLLKAKVALVFNTSNTPTEREVKAFGDPLETLWNNCIFDLCGVKIFHREMFNVVITSTAEQRQQWLSTVRKVVRHCFSN